VHVHLLPLVGLPSVQSEPADTSVVFPCIQHNDSCVARTVGRLAVRCNRDDRGVQHALNHFRPRALLPTGACSIALRIEWWHVRHNDVRRNGA
jgi:hypothetical protein